MKTEDFITVLTADAAPGPGMGQRLWRLLPVALIVSCLGFLAGMGLRADLGAPRIAQAVAMKLMVTLPLALAALACAWRLMQPGRAVGARAALFALPLAVLGVALGLEMQRRGMEQFSQRLFGQNSWRCVLAIPLLSLAPFAALILAFRAGAPVAHARAGALVGLAAAGLGASLYALHCPDDSPLFILAWYSLAGAIMAALGVVFARRMLVW